MIVSTSRTSQKNILVTLSLEKAKTRPHESRSIVKSAILKEPIEKNFESRIVNRFAVDLPFSGMEMIVVYVNHSGDEVSLTRFSQKNLTYSCTTMTI